MSLKYPHETIIMEPTPNATYIYDKQDKREALEDTRRHQEAVEQLMKAIALEIQNRATYHDYTKFKYEDLTFSEHMKLERHHLNIGPGVPGDVNIIDLVEFICDCVSAGAQRSQSLNFNYLKVNESLLQPIINNTSFDLWKIIKVKMK